MMAFSSPSMMIAKPLADSVAPERGAQKNGLAVQTSDGAVFPVSKRLLGASGLLRSLLDDTPNAADAPICVPWASGVQKSVETLLLTRRVELNLGKYDDKLAGAQAFLDATDFLQLPRDTDGLPELRSAVTVAARRHAVLTDPTATQLTADELCHSLEYGNNDDRIMHAVKSIMGSGHDEFPMEMFQGHYEWECPTWHLHSIHAVIRDGIPTLWLVTCTCEDSSLALPPYGYVDEKDPYDEPYATWFPKIIFAIELLERPRTRAVARAERQRGHCHMYKIVHELTMLENGPITSWFSSFGGRVARYYFDESVVGAT